MADEDSGPKGSKDDTSPSPASPGSGEGRAMPRERDFGDSAGYGSGGSALDFHDVGARAPIPSRASAIRSTR